MYSTREAMAYQGKLPEQQNAGITPDLIDLLAMQKVEEDKKAAASQMALAAGQPMPTIAESLKQKALASAKQEIAQKLGLPALAQQQAPQGQAAMPPQAQATSPATPPQAAPQAPPQQAPQGVAAVQSNLPKAYSHGGILSFAGEDESQVPDPAAQYRSIIESNGSEEEKQAALARLLQAQAAGNAGPHNPTPATMAMRRQQAPQRPQEVDRYALTPEMLALQNKAMSTLMTGMNADPEKNSEVAEERFKAATGKNFAEAIEAKKEGLAAIKALQEKDQAGRPSQFWQTINAIGAKGPNVMPGQWGAGVAEKVQGQNEAYNATDIARQKALNDLNDTIHTAIANNDLNVYNAGKAEWVRTMGQLGTSAHDAAIMSDSQLKTLESARATHEVAMGRLQGRSQFAAQQKDLQEARLEEIKRNHGIQAAAKAEELIGRAEKNKEEAIKGTMYGASGEADRKKIEKDFENRVATIYRNLGIESTPAAATLPAVPTGVKVTKIG
jgi:hypothetical protein